MKRTTLLLGLIPGLFAISCNKSNQAVNTGKGQITGKPKDNSAPSAYGTFQFTNVFSSKVLETRDDTTLLRAQSNPKNVQQNANSSTGFATAQNQKWYLIQIGTGAITANTGFKIMNVASGLYLEAPNGTSGTQLFLDHSNGFPSQAWYIKPVSGQSYYTIQNANGLVLTDHASSTANGAPITEETAASNSTQYWNLSAITNEAYRDDAVVQFFRRTHGSISFDQGNSIPLTYSPNNGKVLWVCEDTYSDNNSGWDPATGTYPCNWFFDIRNSALIQPASHSWDQSQTNNLVTHNSTYKYEILPSPADHGGTFTWPGVGIEVNNHVYMYAYEGPANNGYNQSVLYDFTESSTGGLDWGTAVRHTVPGFSDQNNINYGVGMVKPGDGYIYVYGSKSIFLFKNIYVARFAVGTPFSWTYWNGTTWASTPTDATAAIVHFTGHDDGATANVSVGYANGKYVMVQEDYGYGCPSGNVNIYVSIATSPTGPFTAPKQVYTLKDKINGVPSNTYSVSVHPEFNNGLNELLVTYCLNYTGCSGVSACTNGRLDPYYYQVKAIRIPYAAAGL